MTPSDPFTAPEYDRAALITIDVQNDTLAGGSFEVAGTSNILEPIRHLCQTFRTAGRPIIHVLRIYTSDAQDADRCRRASLLAGEQILLKGSAGRRPVNALLPSQTIRIDDDLLLSGKPQPVGPDEILMYKPRWGAFYRTPLEALCREKAVSTLVVCGCNFPNCPRTSIYQASERDFRITAVTDALSGMTPSDVAALEKIGITCASSQTVCEVIESLG
jgi:nicotinamidase-related amidase